MMLKIEADTGKLDASLKKADDGVRKLEASVKIGGRTMRAAVNDEEQLSKALDKFGEASRKAAAAEKNRMAVMAKGFSDTARRAAIEADEANFKRQMRNSAKLQQVAEAQGSMFKRGAQSAASFGLGLLGVGSAAAAVAIPLRALIALQEHQMDLARQSDQQAGSMKDFRSALPAGAAGDGILRDVVLSSAKHGVMPVRAAEMAGPLYATADRDGTGTLSIEERKQFDVNVRAGGMLQSAGVPADAATNMILAGDNQGVSGDLASAKLMKAAEISNRGAGSFSSSGSSISQYDSLDTGLAVATAITGAELNEGRIPERVKDINLALSSAQDSSEFSKKHGLPGLSQTDRIAKLRADAIASGDVKAFTDKFMTQGLDEGKATSLAMLIQQGDRYASAEKQIKSVMPEDLGASIQKLKDDPLVGSAMAAEEGAANAAANALYGAESEGARLARARLLARGAELQEAGASFGVEESGEAKAGWRASRIGAEIYAATPEPSDAHKRAIEVQYGLTPTGAPIRKDDPHGQTQIQRDASLESHRASMGAVGGVAEPVNAPDVFDNEGTSYAAWKRGRALSYLPNYESKRPDGEAGYESKRLNNDPYYNNYESKRPGFRNSYEEKRINNDPYFDKWQMKIPGSSRGYEDKMPGGGNAADMVKVNQELTKALQENTEATKANSTASKTTKAVGGAASNAEEKY